MAAPDIAEITKQIDELNKRVVALGGDFYKDINKAVESFGGGIQGAQKALASLRKEMNSLDTDTNYFYEALKKITKELKGQTNYNRDIATSYSKLSSIANKLKYDQDGISELSKKELVTLGKKVDIQRTDLTQSLKQNLEALKIAGKNKENFEAEITYYSNILKKKGELSKKQEEAQLNAIKNSYKEDNIIKKISESNEEVSGLLSTQEGNIEDIIGIIQTRLKEEEKINKALGISGLLVKGIVNTFSKFGIDSSYFEDLNDELRTAAKNGDNVFKTLIKGIEGGLNEALQDPLVKFTIGLKLVQSGFNDIKKGFDIFLEYNAIFTETARNLGMSTDQITKMNDEAKFFDNTIKGTNGETFSQLYTTKQLTKSMSDMNGQLGLSVDFGAKATDEFTAMTNQMGLSAEEASKIQQLGFLNNISLKDTNESITEGIIAARKSTGVQVDARQVFQDIGKLSAGILTKFQNNPKALAEAVVQAKALGTNLETIDKIGDSLLNWESSINNELEAELITGKQLNLEKARYAALTGNQLDLEKEIASQVGSLSDFQNMNVIAQGSLAKAFGLSRDELADMLKKQEIFAKLGDVSGKSAAEQLALAKERGLSESDSLVVNLKQQAASEKLNATFDALKSTLAEIFSGLQPILDIITFLSKQTWLVYGALTLMAELSFAKAIGGLVLMASQLGLINLTKTKIAAADAASALSSGAQTVEAGALAGETGAISALKTEGAAADAASALSLGAQTVEAGALATEEAIITGEKAAQAGFSAIINPLLAGIGIAVALAAVAAIYGATRPKKTGDIISPSDGKTQISTKEGGLFELSKNDDLLAGPGLASNTNKGNSINNLTIDLTPMIAAINEVRNAVNALANKSGDVHLDGQKVGKTLGAINALGTSQLQNSYQLA